MKDNDEYFLEHLSTELSLHGPAEAKPMVTSVAQAISHTLTSQNAEALVTSLPDSMKSYFATHEQEGTRPVVEHLDELITLVMEEDKKKGTALFKSELQALSVILYTMKRVLKFVDPRTFGIPFPFYREVQDAAALG